MRRRSEWCSVHRIIRQKARTRTSQVYTRLSPRVADSQWAGRGRDAGFPAPPAQIRASAANAHGSYRDIWRKTVAAGRDAGFVAQAGTGLSESGGAKEEERRR